MGITDITFFSVQPMDITRELRAAASKNAVKEVRDWAASGGWKTPTIDAEVDLPPDVAPPVLVTS